MSAYPDYVYKTLARAREVAQLDERKSREFAIHAKPAEFVLVMLYKSAIRFEFAQTVSKNQGYVPASTLFAWDKFEIF